MFNKPILFIVFNRPETTKMVFRKIQEIKPTRLYVAADGARENKEGEETLCEHTRQIVTENINWKCETKFMFQNENLGCGINVSSAISWFFKNEDKGIIIEDDCFPDSSFFGFCSELLDKYELCKDVMQICGSNLQKGIQRGKASYYFSDIPQIWGWATWKDRWHKFDLNYKYLPYFTEKVDMGSKVEKEFWTSLYVNNKKSKINIWGYPWTLTVHAHKGKVIIPNKNLISNVGFGEDASHTHNMEDQRANIPVEELKFPLSHPKRITTNRKADKFVFNTYLYTKPKRKKLTKRIKNKLYKILFN